MTEPPTNAPGAYLKVLQPGLNTSLQDFGRPGWQRYGVPVSGALDRQSLRLANLLAGNRPDMGALEILHLGPEFQVMAERVRVALAGQGTALELTGRGQTVPPWQSVTLARGERFRVAAMKEWVCAYLAVEGGFAAAPALGSVATYARGGLGGFSGRALREGDELPLNFATPAGGAERCFSAPPGDDTSRPIRVIRGPQDDAFSAEALEIFLTKPYRISASSDRMGLRLDGEKLSHASGFDLVSDGIAEGAIQVPGTGQPIVLLADRQTTGGYPKIATIISADVAAIARRRPGSEVRFVAVSLDEAQRARAERDAALETVARSLTAHTDGTAISADKLSSANLISGVVAGQDDAPDG